MDHHNLAELVDALVRLLVVTFSGLSLWLGWRLVCPRHTKNGHSTQHITLRSVPGRIVLVIFAVYLVGFGSYLLVAIFSVQQNGKSIGLPPIFLETKAP